MLSTTISSTIEGLCLHCPTHFLSSLSIIELTYTDSYIVNNYNKQGPIYINRYWYRDSINNHLFYYRKK